MSKAKGLAGSKVSAETSSWDRGLLNEVVDGVSFQKGTLPPLLGVYLC